MTTMISGFHVMYVPGFSAARDRNVAELELELSPMAAVHLYRDRLRQGVLFNYRRMLHSIEREMQETGALWAIGMQDDAFPLEGWRQQLIPALENAPAPVVSLCHFADHGKKLYDRGFAYGTHVHAVWGQAVAYHSSIISSLRQVADDAFEYDAELFRKWDDGLAAVRNLLHGGESCFTTLAIFSHLEGKSTMGHLTNRGPGATIASHAPLDWSSAGSTKFPSGAVKPLILERTEQLREWRAARG